KAQTSRQPTSESKCRSFEMSWPLSSGKMFQSASLEARLSRVVEPENCRKSNPAILISWQKKRQMEPERERPYSAMSVRRSSYLFSSGRESPASAAASPNHPDSLWRSILNNSSESKAVPEKSILFLASLGGSKSGKTTILNALRASNDSEIPDLISLPESAEDAVNSELALSFQYTELKDDDDPDIILARIGLYHLSSHHFVSLIPYALSPPSLSSLKNNSSKTTASWADSLVVISVDWTKPWTFVEELQKWFSALEALVDLKDAYDTAALEFLFER
ncbi:hypothetical protein HK096_010801, partial [Nowakowskiella sp. JEL0078]